MKKRHYILINFLFVGLMLFSVTMVIQFMTGFKPLDIATNVWRKKDPHVQTDKCSDRPPLQSLSKGNNSSLKKLAVYQQACHSFATDTVMIFLSMPKDVTEARQYATEDAKTLQTFAAAKVRPLIMIEPTDKNGALLDFRLFADGTYNPTIDAYFAQLKGEGVTDKQLGIITPFPEANLPYWRNNAMEYFSPAVNNYLSIARTHFSQVETSILLNSATYEVGDFNWEKGEYNSLLPYIKDIKPALITYAGIQGFPWIARQGGAGIIFNAEEFLSPPLLQEMADKFGTKKVWFNTGTFSAKYTLDENQIRHINPSQRKEIMMTIEEQALSMKKKGYDVAVNIFAEDKSENSEETNWSYWKNDSPFTSPDTVLLTTFAKNIKSRGIQFWLFDK